MAKTLATVPKMRPTARLPKTRRSSNSVWSTCGRSKRWSGPEDDESGQDSHQKCDQEIQVRGHRWCAKAGALLKNAEGRLSTLTTGNVGLWSAGRVESASMPGKQARVLCPVCAEPMPPDETECAN